MAMMSTARLIEKMKRFGVSMGSQTSAAPVSPDAQPLTRAAAKAAAATERRTPVANDFDTLAIINANPGSIPAGPGMLGHRHKTAWSAVFKTSVAHAACTLK